MDLADGRWKGSTLLAGSAVEALLLWGLQRHEQHNPGARASAIKALRVGNSPLTRDPDANPENWDLTSPQKSRRICASLPPTPLHKCVSLVDSGTLSTPVGLNASGRSRV